MLVVDLSNGVAGAYTARLLTDAGATVVRVEPPHGTDLRRRIASDQSGDGADGALFRYLDAGKRSVVCSMAQPSDDPSVAPLLDAADVLVCDDGEGAVLHSRHPRSVVVSHSPFGLDGPWAGRPASDLTLQAWSGSIAARGELNRPPVRSGCDLSAWVSGAGAAVVVLAAWRAGVGALIDMSEFETAVAIYNGFQTVVYDMSKIPSLQPARVAEVPGIEPALDGWVGFCVMPAAHFTAFASMVGHPEWAHDPDVRRYDWRCRHGEALRPAIQAWTRTRTVEEIVAEAQRRRVPCVPVGTGESVPTFEQFVVRGVFVPDATGSFLQPRPPARLATAPSPPPRSSARVGEHDAATIVDERQRRPERPHAAAAWPRPLAGIRVFDMTAFWAGPAASQLFAAFGADVIKVESIQRPDGTRASTAYGIEGARPWERAPLFQSCNASKRGITLDMSRPAGRELARRLLAECDILIENFTPRVAEAFGLLDDRRDDLIVVRMPAWGLDGPWRDVPGFAQTMEQVAGLGWVTGYPDGPALVPRGPCDLNGAYHAAFATLRALLERDATGRGQVVESALADAALAVAAEQVVEYSAYGRRLDRIGNRSRFGAPDGVYAAAGFEEWVAISVATDEQWRTLCHEIDRRDWLDDGELATLGGRRRRHDELDAYLVAWCEARKRDDIVDALWSVGVPSAPVVEPRAVADNPQLEARRFFEAVDHPFLGPVAVPGFPGRVSGLDSFHRWPAPMLGQHTWEVLSELLGMTAQEYTALQVDGIVGDVPA
jgi:crotonobetainyl-CoA:carnitine CoA-transferase CaiB-like acyl-CoA transferase